MEEAIRRETVKEALIDGKITLYDWARGEKIQNDKRWPEPDADIFTYLGEGVIYRIDGVADSYRGKCKFYIERGK